MHERPLKEIVRLIHAPDDAADIPMDLSVVLVNDFLEQPIGRPSTAHQHGYTSSGGFLPTLLYTASREQSVEIGVKNGVAGARRARR
jgi:hypothetical protein